jgi:hypothetical protein
VLCVVKSRIFKHNSDEFQASRDQSSLFISGLVKSQELLILKGLMSLLWTLQTNQSSTRLHCPIIEVKENVSLCLKKASHHKGVWGWRYSPKLKLNSVALARERTIPAERPQLDGEVSANFCGLRESRGQRNGYPRLLISVF